MYHIIVTFTDRYERNFFHINKIEYYNSSEYIAVEKDAILNTKFPLLGIYYLYANDGIYVVNLKDAISFEITHE